MSYNLNNQTADSNVTALQTKINNLWNKAFMVSLVIDILIIISSLAVIGIVVCKRRRTEVFIVTLPFLLLFYGLGSMVNFIYLLGLNSNDIFPFFDDDVWSTILGSLTNYILALVYWVFAF